MAGNQAFIDGQNLQLGTTKVRPSWRVDLGRFRTYLKDKYSVSEAYYFMGAFDPQYQDLYNSLQKFGYIVVFREHAESSVSKKKGNVDTDIVFTVMKKLAEKEEFDKVILVSGDGDYWRMVDYLISKGKFGKLLAPNKKAISSLYRLRIPDVYRDYLDSSAIKKKIIYKKR
jgi:uncharacterized LabA/DUF88 family protein